MYTALKANTTFTNLISSRLYDEPLTNNVYPYVFIGLATEVPDNTHDKKGYNLTMNPVIYTNPAGLGNYQASTILVEMNKTLNLKTFTLTGHKMVICKYENASWGREENIRIIVARYRFFTQEN
jgi:hypothetical protein